MPNNIVNILSPPPTPAEITNAIESASASTGVSTSMLQAIAYNESSYGQNSKIGALGVPASANVMQLTPIAIKQINNLGYPVNALDTTSNVQGSAVYLQSLLTQYNGDQQKAIAAYNAGPTAVNNAVATFGSDWLNHVNDFASNGAPDPKGYVNKAQNYINTGVPPTGAPTIEQNAANIEKNTPPPTVDNNPDVLQHSVAPYRELQLDPVSPNTLAAIEPSTVIVQGLDEQPWFLNPNELTGNPKIHTQGYPVTFAIITDRDTGSFLKDSQGNNISIRLNASMRSYNLQSSHIINRTPSRTGLHLTFWGMNADVISGECSTGLFMNQFGITTFLNMSDISDQARQLINNAFQSTGNLTEVGTIIAVSDPDELRIAAQDAFVEFLSLFKNNGVIWYHPDDYSTGTAPDQASSITTGTQTKNFQSAFSPKTGLNTYEMKARNNDVFTRGYIVMNFRSSSYLGFFKSLSWYMDADKPFSWNFNFVFQVERTLSLLYYPFPSSIIPV